MQEEEVAKKSLKQIGFDNQEEESSGTIQKLLAQIQKLQHNKLNNRKQGTESIDNFYFSSKGYFTNIVDLLAGYRIL